MIRTDIFPILLVSDLLIKTTPTTFKETKNIWPRLILPNITFSCLWACLQLFLPSVKPCFTWTAQVSLRTHPLVSCRALNKSPFLFWPRESRLSPCHWLSILHFTWYLGTLDGDLFFASLTHLPPSDHGWWKSADWCGANWPSLSTGQWLWLSLGIQPREILSASCKKPYSPFEHTYPGWGSPVGHDKGCLA